MVDTCSLPVCQKTLIICFDNADPRKSQVMQAGAELAQHLSTIGANPSILWLPAGETKGSIDDYLYAEGAQALRTEFTAALSNTGGAEIKSYRRLMAEER